MSITSYRKDEARGQAGLERLMPVAKADSNVLLLASLLCTATWQDWCYPSHFAKEEAGTQRYQESHLGSLTQLVAHLGFKSRLWLQNIHVTCRHVSPLSHRNRTLETEVKIFPWRASLN